MKDIQINTLGYYVDRTFTNMVKFLNQELSAAGLDLKHPQFTLLMVLGNTEGLSQADLTDFVDRDKASVSRNIKSLEEEAYLKKEVLDGRTNQIFLTEKGKNILSKLNEIANKVTDMTLKGLSENRRKIVYESLTKMYLNVSSAIEK